MKRHLFPLQLMDAIPICNWGTAICSSAFSALSCWFTWVLPSSESEMESCFLKAPSENLLFWFHQHLVNWRNVCKLFIFFLSYYQCNDVTNFNRYCTTLAPDNIFGGPKICISRKLQTTKEIFQFSFTKYAVHQIFI